MVDRPLLLIQPLPQPDLLGQRRPSVGVSLRGGGGQAGGAEGDDAQGQHAQAQDAWRESEELAHRQFPE
jgi:hypothetical protein